MYFKRSVYLSPGQLVKLKQGKKLGRQVTLRIDPTIGRGNVDLYLTQTQINKLNKNKRPVNIHLSVTQMQKQGGFVITIPTLLAGLSAAGALAGGSAAVANAVHRKKHQAKTEKETARHNKAMEKIAASRGAGLYLPSVTRKKKCPTTIGKGRYLPSSSRKLKRKV